jgi:ATP phosphoribosyltransferase regulatory subunit
VNKALDELTSIAEKIDRTAGGIPIRFDLSELSGYGYHNGPVFAAYQADQGSPVAQGGRYDGIGAHFGLGRPATGFDLNLRPLSVLGAAHADIGAGDGPVWVSFEARADAARDQRIAALRSAGEVVIQALGADDPVPARCVRELVKSGDHWVLRTRHGQ